MSPPLDLQYLREAVEAVRDGEPMAEDTYEGLLAALDEVGKLQADVALFRRAQEVTGRHTEQVMAEVERLRAENIRLCTEAREDVLALRLERDDAQQALALARGEGWPEGWKREADGWLSPDGMDMIQPFVARLNTRPMAHPGGCIILSANGCDGTGAGWRFDGQVFSDLLVALRAYQASQETL